MTCFISGLDSNCRWNNYILPICLLIPTIIIILKKAAKVGIEHVLFFLSKIEHVLILGKYTNFTLTLVLHVDLNVEFKYYTNFAISTISREGEVESKEEYFCGGSRREIHIAQ